MHLSPTSKLGYLSFINNTHESTCDVLHSQHWSQYGNTHTHARTHTHTYMHACIHTYMERGVRLSHGRSWVRLPAGHTKDYHENGTDCLPA